VINKLLISPGLLRMNSFLTNTPLLTCCRLEISPPENNNAFLTAVFNSECVRYQFNKGAA